MPSEEAKWLLFFHAVYHSWGNPAGYNRLEPCEDIVLRVLGVQKAVRRKPGITWFILAWNRRRWNRL